MKRLVQPFAVASLAGLAASCAARPPKQITAVCPVCTSQEPEPEILQPISFLPDRNVEASAFVATHVTVTKADMPSLSEAHVRGGVGIEAAVPFMRDGRVRWFGSTALMGGAWGDQQHGAFVSESTTGLKVTLVPNLLQFLDPYLAGGGGLLVGALNLPAGEHVQLGSKLGGGAGIRLFRAFSIQLDVHWVYAVGNPFRVTGDGTTLRSIPDVALSFGIDGCAFGTACNLQPVPQKSADATCLVYQGGKAVCEAARSDTAHPTARQDLCRDAAAALSIEPGMPPVLARDAFGSFLDKLENAERGTPRAGLVSALSQKNRCLEGWQSCGRRQECLLSQVGKKVASRRMYAPYAVEMLAALGCNPSGEAAGGCDYACEGDPPPAGVCP